MLLKTQAATEIARFLAHHPTPEQIVAFHPSAEVAERAYELIQAEREGVLTEEERQELESYVVIEYLMELVKLEAQRQLKTAGILRLWPGYPPSPNAYGVRCKSVRRDAVNTASSTKQICTIRTKQTM